MLTPATKIRVWYGRRYIELDFNSQTKTADFQVQAVVDLGLDSSKTLGLRLATTSNVTLEPQKTLGSNGVEGGDGLVLVDAHKQDVHDLRWAAGLFVYTFFILAVAIVAFVELWPGTSAELTPSTVRMITFYILVFRLGAYAVGPEVLLLCVSILGGIIGACVWSMYAFAKHVSASEDFNRVWAAWYFSRPFIGAGLAVALYAVLRAGLFSTGNSVSGTDVIGVAAISILSGLFAENAIYKLHQIADTVFGNPPDKKTTKPA